MAGITTNSVSVWDEIWALEGGISTTWRQYPGVFGRITWILKNIPKEISTNVLDVGCGVGVLIERLTQECERTCRGLDLSPVAIKLLRDQGYEANTIDLEADYELPAADVLCATEVVEHLTESQFHKFLSKTPNYRFCFISIPNFCMGPDVEPQHHRKLSAIEFLNILRVYRPDWRVECVDHYLLAVAGYPNHEYENGIKPFRLSFTMPVKNEEADIERVLKSFRGVADEVVIGIDSLSTDQTETIARRYADKVFTFVWEKDFSAARNACLQQCTGDWIFMSEGHEHLRTGIECLLRLQDIPAHVMSLEVRRECANTNWYFPWIFRRKLDKEGQLVIKFKNAVHNVLVNDRPSAQVSQISTWHERSLKNSLERSTQRRGMNKPELLDRIRKSKGHDKIAMYYLAGEYSGEPSSFCQRQAIYWFKSFIELSHPCPLRYQAKLALGRFYFKLLKNNLHKEEMYEQLADVVIDMKRVLTSSTEDDPTRVEHWLLLGEISELLGEKEFSMRFFEYAALGVGRIPASYLFIDKSCYSYLPVQKLVGAYCSLGLWTDALAWAEKIEGLLPSDAPLEALEEVRKNIELIKKEKEKACQTNMMKPD